jgi:hypothetical protein
LDKISQENNELEKLEMVLRDMKQVLKEQKQANQQLMNNFVNLQKELFVRKREQTFVIKRETL